MKNNNVREQILTKSPWKLMLELSIPGIVGMVVVGLYSFMDAIFVGQMVNSNAMTAIGVAYPLTLINNGIATLLGVGSASVLSRAIGKKDQETINKIMGNMVAMVVILSLVSTALGLLGSERFLMLAGAEGAVLDYGIKYLRIVFVSSIFVNFAQASNMIMRGEGVMKKAMLIMGGGAVLNIILDPILITLLNPYDMGLEGAALATVISQITQAVFTLMYFKKKSPIVKIGKVRVDKGILPEVIAIGISAMLMQVLTMIQQTTMFHVAAAYGGTEWQTILTATLRVQMFFFIPLWGMSQGFQPAVGTNFGAKKYDRVKSVTKVFILGATGLALVFYIPAMLIPKTMLSLFISEPTIVSMGADHFRLMLSIFFAYGIMIMSITFFQAVGKAAIAGIVIISRQILLFIPLVVMLPKVADLGIQGVFLAPVVTDGIIVMVCVAAVLLAIRKYPKDNMPNSNK